MVKNNVGGNKSKKFARKHIQAPRQHAPLRLAQEGEFYACVTKVYGQGRFQVISLKNEEYMCHLGNKFRGRFKRDNIVALNTWLLVGRREWESASATKRPTCDVLEVYTSAEVDLLRSRVYENWSVFPLPGQEHMGAAAAATEDEIIFSDRDPAGAAAVAAVPAQRMPAIPEESFMAADDIVNIDDI